MLSGIFGHGYPINVGVTALPMPQHGTSELSIERQAVTTPKAARKAKAVTMMTSKFKKSSPMYRHAALKGEDPMFSVKAGNHVKSKAPKRMPKGEYDDHIIEAQTMATEEDGRFSVKGTEAMNYAVPYGLSILK